MKAEDLLYPQQNRPDLEHLANRGSGLSLWVLSWDDVTTFKPVVAEDPYQGWCQPLRGLVRSVGMRRCVSFLERPHQWIAREDMEMPYSYLRRRLREQFEAGDERFADLFKDHGTGEVLPVPTRWNAIQGTLYQRGVYDFAAKPRPRVSLLLPPTASDAMSGLLTDRRWMDELLDPASPTMLEFYQASWNYQVAPRWKLVHQVGTWGEQSPMFNEYGAGRFLARLVAPASPQVAQVPPDTLVSPKFVPWDGVFRCLTVAQQLQLLADVLGPQPVLSGFNDSPFEDVLPVWVRQKRG